MDVSRSSFPCISPEVRRAVDDGRALLLRVTRDPERFLLRVGSAEEIFLNAEGRPVDRVPIRFDHLTADDVVVFVT